MVAVCDHDGRLLRHVAIIMDGNGRWASQRSLPREEGHRAGAESVRRILQAAIELSIPYLTIFAFSSENWRRPGREVGHLMSLVRYHLSNEKEELVGRGVRVGFIGDRSGLDRDVLSLMSDMERATAGGTALTVTVALNYGARDEIVRAARALATDCIAGGLEPVMLDEEGFARHLDTSTLPDPDLIIRTGGEQRLSNFLAWQGAYAELVFLDVPWPEFSRDDLEAAVSEYYRRDRRYGAVTTS